MTDGAYQALGRLPSGVYILTVGRGDSATGMLASWVQQAALEPPMVSVALKTGRPISERLAAGEAFVLNVVGEGQKDLLKHFGKGFAPGEPAFEGIELTDAESLAPVLADALATLECLPTGHAEAGDHSVFLAEVVAGEVRGETPPMVHLRNRGDHY